MVKKDHAGADSSTMTTRARVRMFAVIGGAALTLALLAPVAHAQVDTVTEGTETTTTTTDATATLTDPVGTVTDTVGGVTDGGGTTTTDPIGSTVDTVTDTVGGGGGSTTDTSLVDDPVGGVVEDVKKTVDNTTTTVEDTSGGLTNDVNQTVGGVTNTVGETTGGTLDKVSETVGGTTTKDGTKKSRNGKTSSTGGHAGTSGSTILGASFADAMRQDARAIAMSPGLADIALASSVTDAADSIIEQIGLIARAAAEHMAFPALLMAIVIGFLMIQNRIDRRDPKLAMAPVDSEHDLLSFS